MNKILVEVSAGELLDKISILEIKKEKIKNEEKLKYVNEEYKTLKDYSIKSIGSDHKINEYFLKLKDVNSKLWDIEDNIRICEKNSEFTDKFVQLARSIYFLNDDRANIKLERNKHTGSKFVEVKDYTNYKIT